MQNRSVILQKMGIQEWHVQHGALDRSSTELSETVAEADMQKSVDSELTAAVDINRQIDTDAVEISPNIADIGAAAADSYGLPEIPEVKPNSHPLADLDMQGLQDWVYNSANCSSCNPSNSMLGQGSVQADWMFIIDAPNSRELQAQQFFAGRAGKLFEAMLLPLGMEREDVYVSSIFKCAPTDDLTLSPSCDDVLQRQIELVSPKVIVAFGEFVAQSLIKANDSIDVLRQSEQRCISSNSIVIPTFSPAQMLDDASLKAHVWQDLKKAIGCIESHHH